MNTSQAETVHTPAAGTSERSQLLDTARGSVERQIDRSVQFVVDRLNVSGDWAFLYAHMQASDGGPVDYSRTPKEAAAEAGYVSQVYAGLMRRQGEGWTVVVDAIGPTDMAWAPWSSQHGAPEAIFNE